MRLRKRHLALATVLGVGAAALSVVASLATGPTIEAAEGTYGSLRWNPSTAEVGPGGTVTFKNASATVPHGVVWTSGPETPSCSGVPVNEGKTSWSGSCTFTQAGTYAFKCYVHPTEMTGTITVGSSGTTTTTTPPPPPPPPGESPQSLLSGPVSQALKLPKGQRGGSVRGSVALSQAAAGGRLEVDLLLPRASLAATRSTARVRVGRLIRSPLNAGRVAFTVPLNRAARRALRRHGRLALTVKVIVTPLHGEALTITRAVVVHP